MYSAEDLYTENDDLEIVHEPRNENAEQEDPRSGDEAGEDESTKTVIKPKRVVRNPQPKLDAEALKGPKGLLCLEGYFKNKKYRGKGHEDEDLRSIMKTYEYWCHRLFPKFPFDECISKLEKLGTKKTVQTYLKRIRMNLVEEQEEERRISDDDDDDYQQPVTVVESQFNDLVSRESLLIDENPQLTDDQLERIRLNKERANRLRVDRLQHAKRKAAILTNVSGALEKRTDLNDFDIIRDTQTVVECTTDEIEVSGTRENFQDQENVVDADVNNDISPSTKIHEEIVADTVEDISIDKSNAELSQNSMGVKGAVQRSLDSDATVAEDEIEEFPIVMECD